jgi:hypothetical protein
MTFEPNEPRVAAGAVATCHDELVDALRARKEELALSDSLIEQIGGLAPGHASKLLGPAREKNLSRLSLDVLLKVFAVKIVLVPDGEQAQKMQDRWERRDNSQIHINGHRVSKSLMERARPLVRSEFARQGNKARNEQLARELRVAIARKAGRASAAARRRKRAAPPALESSSPNA